MAQSSVFEKFTNQYALSKTLRFELKPISKTLDNMRAHLEYDEKLQTFLKDQKIEDAYQTLKPHMDELHERFINDSLRSVPIKAVPFADYIETAAKFLAKKNQLKKEGKQAMADNPELKTIAESLDKQVESLRKSFDVGFQQTGEAWKDRYKKYEWKKGTGVAKGAGILSTKDALALIGDTDLGDQNEVVRRALKEFEGFFTYFGGFNQNRENYYQTDKEAATAVATRTIHENLPRFTDNVLAFEARKDEYVHAYTFLAETGKVLVTKDGEELYTPPTLTCYNKFKQTQFHTTCNYLSPNPNIIASSSPIA